METPNVFTAAVVQAAPVFFNKAQTVDKIQTLVTQATKEKPSLILFPEVFIPGYPRGLIRYTTENVVKGKYPDSGILKHILRPRTIIYSVLLTLIAGAFVYSLATRVPLRVDVST